MPAPGIREWLQETNNDDRSEIPSVVAATCVDLETIRLIDGIGPSVEDTRKYDQWYASQRPGTMAAAGAIAARSPPLQKAPRSRRPDLRAALNFVTGRNAQLQPPPRQQSVPQPVVSVQRSVSHPATAPALHEPGSPLLRPHTPSPAVPHLPASSEPPARAAPTQVRSPQAMLPAPEALASPQAASRPSVPPRSTAATAAAVGVSFESNIATFHPPVPTGAHTYHRATAVMPLSQDTAGVAAALGTASGALPGPSDSPGQSQAWAAPSEGPMFGNVVLPRRGSSGVAAQQPAQSVPPPPPALRRGGGDGRGTLDAPYVPAVYPTHLAPSAPVAPPHWTRQRGINASVVDSADALPWLMELAASRTVGSGQQHRHPLAGADDDGDSAPSPLQANAPGRDVASRGAGVRGIAESHPSGGSLHPQLVRLSQAEAVGSGAHARGHRIQTCSSLRPKPAMEGEIGGGVHLPRGVESGSGGQWSGTGAGVSGGRGVLHEGGGSPPRPHSMSTTGFISSESFRRDGGVPAAHQSSDGVRLSSRGVSAAVADSTHHRAVGGSFRREGTATVPEHPHTSPVPETGHLVGGGTMDVHCHPQLAPSSFDRAVAAQRPSPVGGVRGGARPVVRGVAAAAGNTAPYDPPPVMRRSVDVPRRSGGFGTSFFGRSSGTQAQPTLTQRRAASAQPTRNPHVGFQPAAAAARPARSKSTRDARGMRGLLTSISFLISGRNSGALPFAHLGWRGSEGGSDADGSGWSRAANLTSAGAIAGARPTPSLQPTAAARSQPTHPLNATQPRSMWVAAPAGSQGAPQAAGYRTLSGLSPENHATAFGKQARGLPVNLPPRGVAESHPHLSPALHRQRRTDARRTIPDARPHGQSQAEALSGHGASTANSTPARRSGAFQTGGGARTADFRDVHRAPNQASRRSGGGGGLPGWLADGEGGRSTGTTEPPGTSGGSAALPHWLEP